MRACIFVDGENFRHSIGGLFDKFRRQDYLPRDADWTGFFDWVVDEVTKGGERIRTYWYVIQSIDYYPYGLSSLAKDSGQASSVLSRHAPYKEKLDNSVASNKATVVSSIVDELREKQRRMDERFNGWTSIQNGIAARHNAVEFRRAGAIRYDLFNDELGQEKAVDVKLASDMIILRDICDIAIILSGDQDYVPAVQVVKDSGRRVVNVAFRTRSGRLLPGGARRLNQVTDRSINIGFDDLNKFLKAQ